MPRMSEKAQPIDDINAQLAGLRGRIDQLDEKIITLLNERANVVIEVGKVKHDRNSPVYAPDRERAVLERVRRLNAGPISDACIMAIWRELMSGSIALERPMRVGYLGPPGSFSHLASRRKFGASVEYDAVDDIRAVFEEVQRGHVDIGLVPIENSTHGGVNETLDSFLDTTVQVYGEVLINIHHNLLSHHPPEDIKRVYSKAEALAQCRHWLGVQLQHAERVPAASSSRAAALAAEEPGAAAIGSALAAEMYGLQIQFANIEDQANNVTRFFIIAKESAKPSGDDKTSIMFTTAHRAGALADVLDAFKKFGLNLTHIDKRPSKRENWEYYFFVDCLGHQSDENVQHAIEEARTHCLHLTVLGSFPRAADVIE